jgi:hypothetical protein
MIAIQIPNTVTTTPETATRDVTTFITAALSTPEARYPPRSAKITKTS